MKHDVSEGFVRQIGNKFYAILNVDGKREQRATKTSDLDEANEFLANWKADLTRGIETKTVLKYGDIRRAYLAENEVGKLAALRDLDEFFGKVNVESPEYTKAYEGGLVTLREFRVTGMRISNIDRDAMLQFRSARGSRPEVTGYEAEQIEKEFTLQVRKAEVATGKELPAKELKRLKEAATAWCQNGTKATTNGRLTLLRAMFYHAADVSKVIANSDVPTFPLWGIKEVDNKKSGFLTEAQFEVLKKKLPADLHTVVTFIYKTGMRSGAARLITWDMIDDDAKTLSIPGKIMKTQEPLTLPLVNTEGKQIFDFITKEIRRKSAGLVFTITEARLRNEWRKACHELGHGVFDKATRSYRGLGLHDFRRSAARNIRKRGKSESVIMSITGHKTASMFKRYDIIDESDKQGALG